MSVREGDVGGVTLGVFATAVLIGGANFVAVKVTVDELAPLYGAATRFALAGLVFVAILSLTRKRFPRGGALVGAATYGLLGFGCAYALMYFALVELSVGVASVLMATVPVFALALAALQGLERITARGVLGAAVAIGGIAVLSARSLGGEIPFRYLLAGMVAPVVVAQSAIVLKRFPRTDPVATNAVGMLVGAALLAAASVLARESWAIPGEAATWAASAWLVFAGSVGLFWCFIFVVQRWTASASTYAVVLMPVVAVALAALLTGEGFGITEVVGGALVIAGAYIGAVSSGRPKAAVAPADPGGCVGADAAEPAPATATR